MRNTIVILFILLSQTVIAQKTSITRAGFTFGTSAGFGTHISSNSSQLRVSLPNLKLGYMLQPKLGLLLYMPGGVSTVQGNQVAFEAFLPAVQYFLMDEFYLLAGAGLSLETTPFYNVDFNEGPPDFYFGPGFTIAAGYEVFQFNNKNAIDIQTRMLVGKTDDIPGAKQTHAAIDLLIGFNLY